MGGLFHQWGQDKDPFDLREGLWDERIPLDSPVELSQALAERTPDADSLRRLAAAYRQYGRATEALEAARQALAVEPHNFEALLLLGLLQHERGDFPAALEALERAQLLRPSSIDVSLQIGRIHFLLRDFERAREALGRVLRVQPLHFEAHLSTLHSFLKEGRLPEAIRWLREQVAQWPQHADLRYRLGMLLASNGDLAEAAEEFRLAVEISPLFREARWKLSQALFLSGRFEESEIALNHFVSDYPDHAESHYCLGRLLQIEDDREQARAAFDRALGIDPAFEAAHRDLGILLEVQGQPEPALRHMERLVEIQPANPEAATLLSEALARRGQFERALKALEEGLDRMPGNAQLAHQRGLVLLRSGQTDQAREAFAQAAKSSPRLKALQDRLLRIYSREPRAEGWVCLQRAARMGADGPETMRLFEALGELGKESEILAILAGLDPERRRREFVFHRAMAEAQRGAIEAAADVLKVALGEDQTNARFLYWLGMCLAAMGKYNFSTQAYEAAIEEDPLYVYVHENQGFAFGQADKSPGCPCMDYLASVRGTGEAQSLEGRAIEHFNHGRFYFGLRELKAAVRFDPDNPRIHNRMAVAYFDAFQWEEAEQEIRLALAAFPGFSRSHALLALLAEERGDTALARRQWEKHLIFCAQPRWKTKALDRLQRLAFGRAGQPAPRILKADVKPPRVQALSAGSRKSRMAHREVL